MYLTEDNRICTVTGKVPLVGFIDIPNVAEGNICNTNYELKNIIIFPNPAEEHSINIEVETIVKCMVYEEKQINLIQDMYSPCCELNFSKKQVNTMINTRQVADIKKIREKVNFEDVGTKSLIDVDVIPNLTMDRANAGSFDGELECNFTFLDGNMNVEQKRAKIPFDYLAQNIGEDTNSNLEMFVTNQDFIVQDGGEINCNIDMEILGNVSENRSINLIDEVEQEESNNTQDYSVVVYIVKPGDTLWNIAKRFRTTIDFIVRTNGIENPDKIDVGQKLYIPRYSKITI